MIYFIWICEENLIETLTKSQFSELVTCLVYLEDGIGEYLFFTVAYHPSCVSRTAYFYDSFFCPPFVYNGARLSVLLDILTFCVANILDVFLKW